MFLKLAGLMSDKAHEIVQHEKAKAQSLGQAIGRVVPSVGIAVNQKDGMTVDLKDSPYLPQLAVKFPSSNPSEPARRKPILITNQPVQDVVGKMPVQLPPAGSKKDDYIVSGPSIQRIIESHQPTVTNALNPMWVIPSMWDLVRNAGGYLIWNYQDFITQFHNWDGTMMGLFTHVRLMWRFLITGFLTLFLIELGPFIEGLTRLLWEIGSVIWKAFGLVETALSEILKFIEILVEDIMMGVKRITG